MDAFCLFLLGLGLHFRIAERFSSHTHLNSFLIADLLSTVGSKPCMHSQRGSESPYPWPRAPCVGPVSGEVSMIMSQVTFA